MTRMERMEPTLTDDFERESGSSKRRLRTSSSSGSIRFDAALSCT
jgi:hypothetical protein